MIHETDKLELSLNNEDSILFKNIINQSIKKDNQDKNLKSDTITSNVKNNSEINIKKLNLNDTDDHHK